MTLRPPRDWLDRLYQHDAAVARLWAAYTIRRKRRLHMATPITPPTPPTPPATQTPAQAIAAVKSDVSNMTAEARAAVLKLIADAETAAGVVMPALKSLFGV